MRLWTTEHLVTWRDLFPHRLRRLCLLGSLVVTLAILCCLVVEAQHQRSTLDTVKMAAQSQHTQTVSKVEAQWINPEPLPFPTVHPEPLSSLRRFKIPDAEFHLASSIPKAWKPVTLRSGEMVRFQNPQQRGEYAVFSAGCFGACEDVERNIAESLMTFVQRDHRLGRDPRVVHWHVHHKAWAEFSLLYRNTKGETWMIGISTRWEKDWLNALRCEYRAPIHFPYEQEEVLHLAWDMWATQFIKLCRQYEVLSWE